MPPASPRELSREKQRKYDALYVFQRGEFIEEAGQPPPALSQTSRLRLPAFTYSRRAAPLAYSNASQGAGILLTFTPHQGAILDPNPAGTPLATVRRRRRLPVAALIRHLRPRRPLNVRDPLHPRSPAVPGPRPCNPRENRGAAPLASEWFSPL